ncbi:GH92 family glycosyl hydrolase [Crossiella cryophila]|uniref:Putative alpha-1,2-mannosidase n=1 Tax=Crossiella cryophila TaxID=43355 RepID=A0A7W7FT48_9PSEU|nr:GH92 family glycosyl hydrolase [Crossiella cryophila]MBB4676058.1 putative alpha-1,2-mannosidase [Crossiella cryophila]
MRRTRALAGAVTAVLVLGTVGGTASAEPLDGSGFPLVRDPAAYVDPLIGTKNLGNVFPGAVMPFGMLSWSPENTKGNATRTAAPGGYHYDATKIRGFSLTHMSGTGCAGGSGDIPFFPHVGEVTSSPAVDGKDEVYASTFSHANESAKAGRYSVTLDSGAKADLSATLRSGAGRFTFPAGKAGSLLVRTANSEVGSTDAAVAVDPATRTVTGSVTSGNFCGYLDKEGRRSYYKLHFVAEFDQAFSSVGTWQDDKLNPGATTSTGGTTYGTNGWPVVGKGSGAYLGFDTAKNPAVNVRVGISYVSLDNAKANLRAENPRRAAVEEVAAAAREAWTRQLRRIQIGGGTEADRTKFYTALYHSLLHPNVFSDVNGEYAGMDGKVHRPVPGQQVQYGTFSGWDVYRSQVQLLTLLEPKIGSDIAQSLLNQAQQNGGVWDRWTHANGGTHVMNGDPAAPSIAGIHAFGGTDFDVRTSLRSLVKAATVPTALDLKRDGWNVMSVGQRPSLDKYLKHNYMPSVSNAWGGAAETLEISTADFALAQLADRLGDKQTAKTFTERAQWWQNNFDPAAHASGGYIRNRHADGSWTPNFTPGTGDGFVEGSSAQYTWMVQHNVAGLTQAMGGAERVNKRLDEFFHNADGSWALSKSGDEKSEMDNEPSVNVPYLYNYTGQPHKAQQTIREVVNTLWTTGPGGIPGNDDLGAMSSWYVFSALGMYPQVPSRAELVLSSPLFPFARINRDRGKDITVLAPKAAADAPYIHKLRVNGRESAKPWLPESFVQRGGLLEYTMDTKPNTAWGAAAADAPPSWRDGEQPYQIGVGPDHLVTTPGGSTKAEVTVYHLSGAQPEVRYSIAPTPGLKIEPSSGLVPIKDGVGKVEFTVTAETAGQGYHPVNATVTVSGGKTTTRQLTVKVAAPRTWFAALDNTGVSDDPGTHEEANFDGGGYSYSKQGLAAAGLVAGQPGTVAGLNFTWPSEPFGRPDNIAANGQTVQLTAPVSRLSFVGSAINGSRTAPGTVTYTDGSTGTFDLGFSDWTLGGGGGSLMYENVIVAKTPYRNGIGGKQEVPTHILATKPLTAPEGKQIASITFPRNSGLHIFTLATS